MAASYPGSGAKTFTSKATNDTIQAAHVNDLQDEVTAVETALLGTLLHDIKLTTAKKFYEQARTKALGETVAVAFVGGDYSASGGGSITISSGDVTTHNYRRIGDTVWVTYQASNIDVTGVVTAINLKLPASLTSAETLSTIGFMVDGSSNVPCRVSVIATNVGVIVQRLDSAGLTIGTDTVAVAFTLCVKAT